MKHDQGPDSSSKPYRTNRSVGAQLGARSRLPRGPYTKLMRRMACPFQATLASSSGGGGLENQPNGSLIGGSQQFQPATKPSPPAKPGLTIHHNLYPANQVPHKSNGPDELLYYTITIQE